MTRLLDGTWKSRGVFCYCFLCTVTRDGPVFCLRAERSYRTNGDRRLGRAKSKPVGGNAVWLSDRLNAPSLRPRFLARLNDPLNWVLATLRGINRRRWVEDAGIGETLDLARLANAFFRFAFCLTVEFSR